MKRKQRVIHYIQRMQHPAWGYLLVIITALLLRVLHLGVFVTHDEAEFWIVRSEMFLQALQAGYFADTAISTHPGVTTMWLGMVGIFLRRMLRAWGIVAEVPFPLLLALMQAPVALVHTVVIGVSYRLLRLLMPASVAFLAAMLWATDPFIVGYSRLLHVDALASSFATLSILAACAYWYATPQHRWLVVSAISGALALLSKSPSLALLPVIGVIAAVAWWNMFTCTSTPSHTVSKQVTLLLIWCAVFAITVVVVYPALWVNPQRVYETLRTGVEAEAAHPHMTGNFFLGRENPAPGWLFYPVVLALRTTPWTLIGVLLLGMACHPRYAYSGDANEQNHVLHQRTIATMALFIVLVTVGLSIFPKKFNRYLVLVFPLLNVLAAYGIVWIGRALTSLQRVPTRIAPLLHAGIIIAAICQAMWYHPYAIVYYNQLLGGTRAGARTFSVGWGEGFDRVAAWLNQQPDITGVVTASIMMKTLNPYLQHGAQATTPRHDVLPDKSGYVVVYVYQAQGTVFPPFDQFYPHAQPLHVVTLHGVEYAWIYQVAPPVDVVRSATFASNAPDAITLRGYSIVQHAEASDTSDTSSDILHMFWQTHDAPTKDYWLFVHVFDEQGQRMLQMDIPYSTSEWGAHRFITTELPMDAIRHNGKQSYRMVIGLYHPETGRLPLVSDYRADATRYGDDALLFIDNTESTP